MAKLKMKYELIGDIPDEFLKMVKINNTSSTISQIKKELDSDYGSDLVNFESDLQIEIIDEVQDD
ncbi:hypothetical protein HMPREF9628_00156 [Peptoanaerobacter stomatis]|uniref:Uncharacterized protein n=1 Tax=Peptoanaerobacter stomatis TaxID=796937 RepID=G9XBU8_9FIRM|nr:hypothetical protein [Peptoanaerobacter stomatis]EHL19435.1 hypothetical protein HMPREF9628_00156 [Peptoanaerobacter stomatis]